MTGIIFPLGLLRRALAYRTRAIELGRKVSFCVFPWSSPAAFREDTLQKSA